MGIPVVCTCGQHFRAREEQGGRWAFCPACDALVFVPSPFPPEPIEVEPEPAPEPGASPAGSPDKELTGPILVRLRARQIDPNQSPGSVWVPLEAEIKPPPEQKARRRRKQARPRATWKLENSWLECLLYPLHAWRLVVGLGAALGILATFAVAHLPRFSETLAGPNAHWVTAVGLLGLLVGPYAISFLHCVLASACAGEYLEFRWPGYDVKLVFRSCLTWLLCFLAGPALYAGTACWFWLQAGDLVLIDQLILIELGLVTADYWLLGVLAAAEKGSLIASPQAIAALFWRLGYRAVPALLVPPVLVFVTGRFAVAGLEEFHRDALHGSVLVACAGVIGMFLATFFLRYLGLLVFRSRHVPAGQSLPPVTAAVIPPRAD